MTLSIQNQVEKRCFDSLFSVFLYLEQERRSGRFVHVSVCQLARQQLERSVSAALGQTGITYYIMLRDHDGTLDSWMRRHSSLNRPKSDQQPSPEFTSVDRRFAGHGHLLTELHGEVGDADCQRTQRTLSWWWSTLQQNSRRGGFSVPRWQPRTKDRFCK